MLKRQTGIALFSVLLVVASLAAFSAYYLTVTKQNQLLLERIQNRMRAELKADSAMAQLKMDIIKGTARSADISVESLNSFTNQQELDAPTTTFNYYGAPFTLGDNVQASVLDVASLIPYNNPKASIIERLLMQLGESEETATRASECLQDWTDWDDLKRLNGGESYSYTSMSKVPPRNAMLMSKAELQLICGWDKALVDKVSPYLTPYNYFDFYPVMADPVLVEAFYQDQSAAEKVLDMRSRMAPTEIAKQLESPNALGVRYTLSGAYRLRVEAHVGKVSASRELVLDTNFKYKNEPPISTWHWVVN